VWHPSGNRSREGVDSQFAKTVNITDGNSQNDTCHGFDGCWVSLKILGSLVHNNSLFVLYCFSK